MTRHLAIALLVLGACTFEHGAAQSDFGPDAGTVGIDASDDSPPPLPDAPVVEPDAPPGSTPVTLSQNTSNTVSSGASVYCGNMQSTRDNAWYRAFKVSDYGVTGTLHISRVTFGVEGSKGATVRIAIHEYTGTVGSTLDLSKMTELSAKTGTLPDNATPIVALFSVDVPASSTIVLEVKGQDTLNGGGFVTSYLHIGANGAGQSGSTYWRSAACGVGTPTSQGGSHHVILWMDGMYQ